MNKIMQNMMKPLPVRGDSRAAIRLAQEDRVLKYLSEVDKSVTAKDISISCHGIPLYYKWDSADARVCSKILQRLEQKGHVISTFYCGCRYYSIPMNGGER